MTQLFSSTGYEFPRKLSFSCSVRSPRERNKAVHNLLYLALMQRACHVHLFSRSSNTASKPVYFCREFCCKTSYLEIVPKSCDLHNDTGSFRGQLLVFHSTEQQTLSARMEWFKFMMLTPRSSCKLCLCLWPSDSHDLLLSKNAPSKQTSVLFFPVIIPNAQFFPAYYHIVTLPFDDPSAGMLPHLWTAEGHHEQPRSLLSFFQSSQQGGPSSSPFLFKKVGRRLGLSGGSHKNHICSPVFYISSCVGSGNFQIYTRAYLWAISVPYQYKNSRKKSERLSCPRIKYRIIPYSNPINLE